MRQTDDEKLRDIVGATEEFLDTFGLAPEARARVGRQVQALKARLAGVGAGQAEARQALLSIREELQGLVNNRLAKGIAQAITSLLDSA
jgi:hypothetical protein